MHKKWLIGGFIFFMVITSIGWFITAQFLVEKKEKKTRYVSTTALREQCAREMGAFLEEMPTIMQELAIMQSTILHSIFSFFDGEKKCFLLSLPKDQLCQLQKKLIDYKQSLMNVKKTLQEINFFLTSIKLPEKNNKKRIKSNIQV